MIDWYIWNQNSLARRSINFVIIIFDTQMKRVAELSIDHHLLVSWIRWLGRHTGLVHLVSVFWECLAEAQVKENFNSHLQQRLYCILGETGNMELELFTFQASITEAAV